MILAKPAFPLVCELVDAIGAVCPVAETRHERGHIMTKLTVGAAVLLAFAVSMPHGAEAAVCKRKAVSTTGDWRATFAGARLSARLAWKQKARALHGARYDTWLRAANKSYGCWSSGGRERCRATARPCRPGA